MKSPANVLGMRRSRPVLPPRRGLALLQIQSSFLAFVAAIAVMSLLMPGRSASLFNARLAGTLTVQIMPVGDTPPPAEIAATIAALKSFPGVTSTAVMTKEDNLALVTPWLGRNSGLEGLPFPALIDVRLAPGSHPDLAELRKRLLANAPHAVVDGNTGRLSGGSAAAEGASPVAIVVLCVAFCAFALSFASVNRAQLSLHREALDLLQLLGASDRRMRQIFARRGVVAVLFAAGLGTAFAAGIMAVAADPRRFGITSAPFSAAVSASELTWLAFIPVTAAIIAWLTSRVQMNRALRSRF